jgi:hypothetical protein
MTAPSETFCDEDVRDAAKDAFGKLIPEHEHIRMPKEWRDIWSDEGYPREGTIEYEQDEKTVAKVHFDTKFEIKELNGLCIAASPTHLVLELPDGKKFHDKQGLIDDIKECIEKVTELRDNQEAVPCDGNECLCNSFDQVLDGLRDLIDDINAMEAKENDAGIEMRAQMR